MADHDYEDGVRDGRIKSLEDDVRSLVLSTKKLTDDILLLKEALSAEMSKLKAAIWALYGAILLIEFLVQAAPVIMNILK